MDTVPRTAVSIIQVTSSTMSPGPSATTVNEALFGRHCRPSTRILEVHLDSMY